MNNRLLLPPAFVAALTMLQDPAPRAAVIQQLMDKELVGVPGRELLMPTLEYLPLRERTAVRSL
jgi:hypothetical protein